MKKLLLVLWILFFASSVFAYEGGSNDVGLKLDMPDLVKFSKNVSLGAEVSKTFASDVDDDWQYLGDKEGGFNGLVKLTVKWSLLDFSKKDQ